MEKAASDFVKLKELMDRKAQAESGAGCQDGAVDVSE